MIPDRLASIRKADQLDVLLQEAEDHAALDQEQADLVAERGSVQAWLVTGDDAERLLRRKVRDLFADAYEDAA